MSQPNMDSERTVENGTLPNGKTGLRVLVVEDNPDSAESLALLLRRYGHKVSIALDGPRAIELARASPPDVVLLDLGLPGMDGCQVAKRLNEQATPKPSFLIAVTGYGWDSDRQRTHEAGFNLHLLKPVDPEQLKSLLMKLQPILMN